MARRSCSWLLRLTMVCVLLALMLSVGSVEAAKKKKSKATPTPTAASASATAPPTGSYSAPTTNTPTPTPTTAAATPAASIPTPVTTPEPVAPATPVETAAAAAPSAEDVAKAARKAEKRAAASKAARARNTILAQRRIAKVARLAKSRAAAKIRADELIVRKRAADTPEIRAKGQEKLRWLSSQTSKSSTRMINFDSASNFHQFVNEGPRPYHLMMQFTALTSSHNCPYCHLANDALTPVALAHYERSQKQSAFLLAANSTADIPEADLPVFFATIEMARSSELFKELKFQSAPNLLLAPSRLSTTTMRGFEFIKTLPGRYRFSLSSSIKPEDLAGFIAKNTRISVSLDAPKPGFMELLTMLLALSCVVVVGLKYGLVILQHLRALQGIKYIILIVGCGLYCWCIGGGMYNVLKGTQWASSNRDGSTNFINGDARDQFAAEGIIIGILNLACGLALVAVNTFSFEDTPTTSSGKTSSKQVVSPVQNVKNLIAPFMSPAISMAVFIFLWTRIIGIYNMKNPGYRFGLVWRI